MDNKTLEKILIGLGVGTIAILGLVVYLQETPEEQTTTSLSYYEYLDLLKSYNAKIEYIKTNCDTDKRCIKDNGEAKVIFQQVNTKEDIVAKMNEWLQTEDSVFVK